MTVSDGPLLPSEEDVRHLSALRANVESLMRRAAATYATSPGRLLDIAPQEHAGARPFFGVDIEVITLDIDPSSGCDVIGDICTVNEALADGSFDYVVCTEVLEHTLRPFDAVAEIRRLLKPDGFLFASAPLNFRIHGPLPDCWRFTEHGWRELLREFSVVELTALETEGRPLMPVHYTVVAQR